MVAPSTFLPIRLKVGDVVTIFGEKAKKQAHPGGFALAEQIGTPGWVQVDLKKMEGVFKSAPERADLAGDINEQPVVEFHRK